MDQKISSRGAPRATSATLVAGAAVLRVSRCGSSWCRVNGTGSPSDPRLELWEGRVAYYRLKKEAIPEIPGKKCTINLNAAVLAGADRDHCGELDVLLQTRKGAQDSSLGHQENRAKEDRRNHKVMK
ncbi:hypothetical protein P7K49_028237 [Saguinus oedipus]|uniref:Uncharacterized protein n=1 Tax=Saguinus oedipus TaxID=9490 RepID=A0ABQ9UBQ3_SAGOE|nr:hypothetical protein P7K49_028237 [Saguinus oedipus]